MNVRKCTWKHFIAIALVAGCSKESALDSTGAVMDVDDGEIARLRLTGPRPMLFPGSRCFGKGVPGSGVPSDFPIGGPGTGDEGVPQSPDDPEHVAEVSVRADAPLTVSFTFSSDHSRPGPVGASVPEAQRPATCTVARSFVPDGGRDYEWVSHWYSTGECAVIIHEIAWAGADFRREPVPSDAAFPCEDLDAPQKEHASPET